MTKGSGIAPASATIEVTEMFPVTVNNLKFNAKVKFISLFELEVYSPVNTVKVMSSPQPFSRQAENQYLCTYFRK